MMDHTDAVDAPVQDTALREVIASSDTKSSREETERDRIDTVMVPPVKDEDYASVDEADSDARGKDLAGSPPEQDLEEFIGEGQTKYELRQKTRDVQNGFTRTWIDDDKTGLYDPAEEQRRLRKRPKRPNSLLKLGFKPWDLDKDSSDEKCELRAEPRAKILPKLEVRLSFASEAAIIKFREQVNSLPAQIEPSEELLSERRLRRRNSGVDLFRSLSRRHSKKKPDADDLPENFTGHPVARGCWECLRIGIRCPLLDDQRAWPCTTCLDDDHECELITPPQYKRPCESCKGKRHGCSFTYTLDHDGPCEECSRTGYRCIAGPAKEAIRERISYDRDWQNDPWQAPKELKLRKAPGCQRCRERGQPCSFATGDKSEVCTACDMAGEDCFRGTAKPQQSRKRKRDDAKSKDVVGDSDPQDGNEAKSGASWGDDIFGPELQPQASKTKNADQNVNDCHPSGAKNTTSRKGNEADELFNMIDSGDSESSSSSEESDPEPPPAKRPNVKPVSFLEGPQKTQGTLRKITTNFSHPIQFNYEGDRQCNFCTDLRFGMFGLGEMEVEVVAWHDGRGFEEMGGGHRGRGIERTRMCVSCTTQRMPVITCAKHEPRPLGDSKTAAQNNVAVCNLLHGTTTGRERWCSVCPALAQYECCRSGPYGKGCGLLLCEACMVLTAACDGSLDQALKHIPSGPSQQRPVGVRADHEFLRKDGLLVKHVLWESQRGRR